MTKQEKMYSLIAEYRQGGVSAKTFCLEKDIRFSTFQYWIRKQKKVQLSEFIPITAGISTSGSQRVEVIYPSGIRLNLCHFDLHQISQLLNLH